MFKKILAVLKPNLVVVFVFAILAAWFLTEQYQFNIIPKSQSCPTGFNENVNIGSPYSYYQFSRGDKSSFHFWPLLFNIAVFYLLALGLYHLSVLTKRTITAGTSMGKLVLGSFFINIGLVIYIVIMVFGHSILVNAVKYQNYTTVKLLLAAGVNANRVSVNSDNFPLKAAARTGNIDIMKLLLNSGASPKLAGQDGRTALHVATSINSKKAARLLLKSGADINATDGKGKTSLHLVCSHAMASLLASSGANPNITDRSGKKPADYIRDKNILSLLTSYKATPSANKTLVDRQKNPDKGNTVNRAAAADKRSLSELVRQNADMNIIRYKIEQGANVDRRDEAGKSAFYYALQACNIKLGKLLLKHSGEANRYLRHSKGDAIFRNLVMQRAACWGKVTGNPVSGLPRVREPSRTIQCETSLGGNLIRKGKRYPITQQINGVTHIYQNGHGFIYADCHKQGYYHLIVEGQKGYRKLWPNMVSDPKDPTAPLLRDKKDVALISFDLSRGQARLRWYFSAHKVSDLLKDIRNNKVFSILVEDVFIKSPD